jgi:hypothetical protein
VRVGAQYIWYNKLDGDTVHARDDSTLLLYAWQAM